MFVFVPKEKLISEFSLSRSWVLDPLNVLILLFFGFMFVFVGDQGTLSWYIWFIVSGAHEKLSLQNNPSASKFFHLGGTSKVPIQFSQTIEYCIKVCNNQIARVAHHQGCQWCEHYNPLCIRRKSLMSYSSIHIILCQELIVRLYNAWSLTTILRWAVELQALATTSGNFFKNMIR